MPAACATLPQQGGGRRVSPFADKRKNVNVRRVLSSLINEYRLEEIEQDELMFVRQVSSKGVSCNVFV
jgi:hypothetical protein